MNLAKVFAQAMVFLSITSVIAAEVPNKSSMPDEQIPVVRLERHHSCTTCPAYEIAIFDDGRVRYKGNALVNQRGIVNGEIKRGSLNALMSRFEVMKFFELKDVYSSRFMDGHLVELTFKMPGREKTVKFLMSFTSAPDELIELVKEIEKAVGVHAWICPTATPRQTMC